MHYVELCTPQQNIRVYCQDLHKENPATSTITTLGTVALPEKVTNVSAPRIPGSKHCAVYFIVCHVTQIRFTFIKFL